MNELLPGLDFSGYIQGRAEICNRIRRGFDEIEDAIKMAKDGKLLIGDCTRANDISVAQRAS